MVKASPDGRKKNEKIIIQTAIALISPRSKLSTQPIFNVEDSSCRLVTRIGPFRRHLEYCPSDKRVHRVMWLIVRGRLCHVPGARFKLLIW